MEIAIIIVGAIVITIIASLMIVKSRRSRRTHLEIPGSNRPFLSSPTGSSSLSSPALSTSSVPTRPLLASSAQSTQTGSDVSTMQAPTPNIRVRSRRPGTTSGSVAPAVTPATNGASAAPSGTEATLTTSSITVKQVRRPQEVAAAPPPDLEDPIRLPDTVQIFNRQTICKVCKGDIRWSSRRAGWARCLKTNRLVHGYCRDFAANTTSNTNWCAICNGPCASGQPMRIEGIDA